MSVSPNMSARHAGTLQGILCLLPITMAVMGVVVLAPVLPRMQEHFRDVPGAEYLVPIALTIPALCIALLSPIAGAVVDFFGRRRTLIVSLVLYAGIGLLPLVLDDLMAIIASRVLLGAMEAAIVTASTTLIGDYFHGKEREKWLAYQTALASASAVVLFGIGGALGNASWRGPFAVYGTSLLIAAALMIWTWEPQRYEQPAAESSEKVAFPWQTMGPLCALAAFGGIMFFTMQIQLGYLLTNHYAISSPSTIGLFTAIGSLSVPLGSFAYRKLAKLPLAMQLLISFSLIGVSFILMNHAPRAPLIMAYLVVNQFGCGILLPTLVVWTMGRLPFAIRGRGTGLFMSGWWIGQFLSPQVITVLGKRVGGLPPALQVLGVLCLIAAALAAVTAFRSRSPAAAEAISPSGSAH